MIEKNTKIRLALLWIGLIISDTTAQLLLKSGAVKASLTGWMPNYFIMSGYSLYVISFLIWMQILKTTRLFIALAAASVVYITVALSSHFFMNEVITIPIILGTLFVSAGVFLLGWKRADTI